MRGRLAASPPPGSPSSRAGCIRTSRSIIRATSLHLLPGLHEWSIYQILFLGSCWHCCQCLGKSHLECRFALRCFQRFSVLGVAIQLWRRPPNWLTSGPALSVLSYWRGALSLFLRPRRIETELSRDVLNPARVPLSWANSPTLGTYSSPRMRRADIEVPNLAVDVNSWARSACYPRGSFCPLSHTPSTWECGITKSDFRPCSACPPRSQAPLCT